MKKSANQNWLWAFALMAVVLGNGCLPAVAQHQSRLGIGVVAAPQLSLFRMKSSAYEVPQGLLRMEQSKPGFSVGGRISYQVSPKLQVQSGVGGSYNQYQLRIAIIGNNQRTTLTIRPTITSLEFPLLFTYVPFSSGLAKELGLVVGGGVATNSYDGYSIGLEGIGNPAFPDSISLKNDSRFGGNTRSAFGVVGLTRNFRSGWRNLTISLLYHHQFSKLPELDIVYPFNDLTYRADFRGRLSSLRLEAGFMLHVKKTQVPTAGQ